MNEKNLGLVTLNNDASGLKNKTVIVLGAARGGTSMIAGTLSRLGVYMGQNTPPLYEDESLSKYIDDLDKNNIKKIITERNINYALWGIKKPSLKLLSLRHLFREPVYIVVFRDIFATANRRVISKNQSLFSEMFKSYYFYLRLLIFLRFNKRPVLMVSYEKSLLQPENLVEGVTHFLGLHKNSVDYKHVANFIQSSPDSYTQHQRFLGEEWVGYVDRIASNSVAGWVASKINANKIITIELIINDIYQQSTQAVQKRVDVKEKNPQLNQNCGFLFKLPHDRYLNKHDKVEVRIYNENIFLKKITQHSDL